MRIVDPAALVMVAALAGCAESQFAGSLVYMAPYRYEQFDCTELKKRAAAATARVKDQQQLMDKASGSVAGAVINPVVYGPEYSKARWEQRLYEDEIARKNCNPPPPEAPPPQPAQ